MDTRHVRLILAAAATLCVCGCALLVPDRTSESGFGTPEVSAADTDAGSGPIRLAAGLEAGIITRPRNDVRIRKLIWEQLDESGLMAPEFRQRLNASGFRVGVAGSSSPWALQSLARDGIGGERTAAAVSSSASGGPVSVGPRFTLMQGGSSRLELQPFVNLSVIPVEQISELSGVRDLSNLKCVIELTVEELEPDWVQVKLLPQLHVGARTARLSVDATTDQLPIRQRIIPLYEQQCRIRLHRGEVAVVGLQASEEWTPGAFFFCPDRSPAAQESILLIRLDDIDRLKGEIASSGGFASKYPW